MPFRLRLFGILLLTAVLGTAWALSVPLHAPDYWSRRGNWFPDEADHLSVVRFWAEHGHPPPYEPPYMTGQHPPLYYLLGAALLRVFGGELLAVRALSIVTGLLTVWFAGVAARRLAGREVGLLATAIVALVPMRAALSGAASNENLATCLAAATLALLASATRTRRPGMLPLLALCAALGVGAKLTALGLILAALPLVWRLWRGRGAVWLLAIASALTLGAWGWWLAWNERHFGDWLMNEAMHRYWDGRQPGYDTLRARQAVTLPRYLFAIAATGGRSFWGAFSGVSQFLPVPVYALLIGWHLALPRELLRLRRSSARVRAWWLGVGLYAGFLLAVFASYNLTYFTAQGRYLQGLLAPLALLLARGWLRCFPPAQRKKAGGGLVLALLLLNVYCLAVYPPWR